MHHTLQRPAAAPPAGVGETPGGEPGLPELAAVPWRPRADDETLRRRARGWTLTSWAHAAVLIPAAVGLAVLRPVLIPLSVIMIGLGWTITELWANKGAAVVLPRPRAGAAAERTALLLLGDLLDHEARELHAETGLALQRGQFGVWLVGEAGAILVRGGGRRVFCYCVRVTGTKIPSSDLISHLLLALRTDEAGFATVANLAFSGAPWRVRRRMRPEMRPALTAAIRVASGR